MAAVVPGYNRHHLLTSKSQLAGKRSSIFRASRVLYSFSVKFGASDGCAELACSKSRMYVSMSVMRWDGDWRKFLRAGSASRPARLWLALTRSEDGRWIGSWKILEVIALYRLFDDKRYLSL